MELVLAIVFGLLIVAVTVDVIRRWPQRSAPDEDDEALVTTQKIIVDLNRR